MPTIIARKAQEQVERKRQVPPVPRRSGAPEKLLGKIPRSLYVAQLLARPERLKSTSCTSWSAPSSVKRSRDSSKWACPGKVARLDSDVTLEEGCAGDAPGVLAAAIQVESLIRIAESPLVLLDIDGYGAGTDERRARAAVALSSPSERLLEPLHPFTVIAANSPEAPKGACKPQDQLGSRRRGGDIVERRPEIVELDLGPVEPILLDLSVVR